MLLDSRGPSKVIYLFDLPSVWFSIPDWSDKAKFFQNFILTNLLFQTLPRSTSSTIRPSTLVTHDLHSPSQTKENGSVFANIDVQARGPLPGESVETASEPKKPPLSSVTHTHHHYHYHHRLAPKGIFFFI